jgi:hypothetical protein
VVFQDKALVPAGQAGFSRTLNAPVLVFSQPWMVVPEAAGSSREKNLSHHSRPQWGNRANWQESRF